MPPKPASDTANGGARVARPPARKAAALSRKRIRALSHPVRAQALRLLSDRGKMSPAEIGREIGESTDTVSYHCKQLVAYDCAEMVEEKRVAGKGAIEHFYIATTRTILEDVDWETLDLPMGEAVLNEIVAMIVEDYETSQAAGLVGRDGLFHITRTPLLLDEQGLKESMENSERWRLEQSEIELRSAARRAQSGERGVHVSSSLALFKVPKPKPKSKA